MTQEKSGASQAAGSRYEVRDADVKTLLQFGVALCLVIVLALFGVSKLMAYLAARQPEGQPASPLAQTADLPPKPRLQITPRLELAEKRNADDAVLNSYAWIDRPSGTVRIPIDRAMELVAERERAARDLARTPDKNRRAANRTPRLKRSDR